LEEKVEQSFPIGRNKGIKTYISTIERSRQEKCQHQKSVKIQKSFWGTGGRDQGERHIYPVFKKNDKGGDKEKEKQGVSGGKLAEKVVFP